MDNLSERSDFKYPTLPEKKKKKDELKKFKQITMILEIILIILILVLICSQMIIGLNIYNQFLLIKGSFFYEALLYYIRNLDFKFEIKESSTAECHSNMKKIVFQKVSYIKGIYIETDDTTKNTNFYYENIENRNLDMNTLSMDVSQTINYWNGVYYCKTSYSSKYIKFYFLGNALDCDKNDIKCGTYYGYSFCMHIIDKQNIHETSCPFMNVRNPNDGPIPEGLVSNELKINEKKFRLIKNVSDDLNVFYYSFRLSYGNLDLGYDNSTLSKPFISYYRDEYIDFGVPNRSSLLPVVIGSDDNKGFLVNYFNPVILNPKQNKFTIRDNPRSPFSLRLKFNYLPNPDCLPFFEKTEKNNEYFIENFKLFVDHIDISGTKYIGFSIIDLIYTFLFYIYYRGFLILKTLTSKISPVDEDNEEISLCTKFIFSFFLVILKFFNNFIQSQNIQENLDFSNKMNVNNCFDFNKDPYMHYSLKYYHDQVLPVYNLTRTTLLLLFIQLFFSLIYILIRNCYFIKKKNFFMFVQLYKVGLKKKMK